MKIIHKDSWFISSIIIPPKYFLHSLLLKTSLTFFIFTIFCCTKFNCWLGQPCAYAQKQNTEKNRQNFCYLSSQVFNQFRGSISSSGVPSTYSFTAATMLFKNCECGDYLSRTGAYVKDSGTLGSSKNYLWNELQTLRLRLYFCQ